jgi:hypothetical protein
VQIAADAKKPIERRCRRSSEMKIAALAAAVCLVTLVEAPAGAQWLNYPTPGIPRTADGKPNLSAPAPRTADGKPDLSGMWNIGGLGSATNITDIALLPAAEAIFKKRLETYGTGDPATSCLPEGPRSGLAGLDPLRIVQTPTIVVVLYEAGAFRLIYTDGRPLPKDMNPTWMGYSVGRWDGDTFVIETAGYNDKTWLDFAGRPHSDALRVTERFRRIDFGHMQLEMTFDDPKAYAKPFTIKAAVAFVADDDLIENVCLENEKDLGRLVGKVEDEKKSEKRVAANVLAQYEGTYNVGPLGMWTVSVVGGQLAIELPDGGGKQTVFARAENVFVFPSVGGTVTFVREKNAVTHFLLTIVEGDFRADRK